MRPPTIRRLRPTLVAKLSGRPRWEIQRMRQRLDDKTLRNARRLVRRLRSDPPGIVHMGSSESEWIAPYDRDRRSLTRLVSEALDDDHGIEVFSGHGYHPALFLEFLRLVRAHEARPLVVHSIFARAAVEPWIRHPIYGYEQAISHLREVDPHGPLRRIHAFGRKPAAEDFERHAALPYDTLLGPGHVRDYVVPLRSGRLGPDEHVRLLFAYHHTGRLDAGSVALENFTRFGRALREAGCRSIAYHMPFSVDTGVDALGPAFAEHVAATAAAIDEAYLRGTGDAGIVIRTSEHFTPDEFVDPLDATEHLNARGRAHLRDMLVSAARASLAARPAP
jgi:hypothetical protein